MVSLVSIIIPTYNRKNWVTEAIDSALKQSYEHIEVIVIDDGSTDGTYSHLKGIYNNQIILKKIKHKGVSAARNIAISMAMGEWISFLDSDDFFHRDKIEKQIKILNKNPNYHIAHSEEIWYKNGIRINPKKKHQKTGGYIFAKSVDLCSISISTVILKKSLFSKIGNFDETMQACEDYELWLRITAKYNILFINEYLTTKFGGHKDQLSMKYVAMDRFRIYALNKLLKNNSLNNEQRAITILSLRKRLQILLNGAKKHHNYKRYVFYAMKYFKYI